MSEQNERYKQQVEAVDAETLTPMVQKLFDDPTLSAINWTYEPLIGGFGAGAGPSIIYRFSGTCAGQNGQDSWSLILKIVLARPDEAPADPKYWKREYELYRAGMLDELPSGIRAPSGLGVNEYPNESAWFWTEEIEGGVQQPWTDDQYAHVSHSFGQFNGAYLTGEPIPDFDWLSIDWMPKMMTLLDDRGRPPIVQMSLAHPLAKGSFPIDAVEQYTRLWDERNIFVDALNRLPQTFAHQDGVGRNMFLRPLGKSKYETIVIDWAFAGKAPVGLDGAMHILVDLFVGDLPVSRADSLDRIVFDNYMAGLQDVGWHGNERQVRLGYTASTALKYLELINPIQTLTDEKNRDFVKNLVGHSIEFMIDQFGGMHRYAHQLADEARLLINAMD